ncbi:hypothetical protein V8G54_033872 [Vigna mungo]|uniref:Uncharacterized protein n=1 Tax=Vigna mungo TaxID=3915 RepID=A0AAQ3MQK2_VIGMU
MRGTGTAIATASPWNHPCSTWKSPGNSKRRRPFFLWLVNTRNIAVIWSVLENSPNFLFFKVSISQTSPYSTPLPVIVIILHQSLPTWSKSQQYELNKSLASTKFHDCLIKFKRKKKEELKVEERERDTHRSIHTYILKACFEIIFH